MRPAKPTILLKLAHKKHDSAKPAGQKPTIFGHGNRLIVIAKFAKILRVTGVETGVGVLIFDVNRSRIGVGFCNFGAGLESESQKSDSGHLWSGSGAAVCFLFIKFSSLFSSDVFC